MDSLFEANGVFQYIGRNLGCCCEEDCDCDVYCAPSPIGGQCANCGHHPLSHCRLCDKCQDPILDEKSAYHLCCLDLLCEKCEASYKPDEDIICPRCSCLTPRKPFVISETDKPKEKPQTLEDHFQTAVARVALLEKQPSTDIMLQLYSLFKQQSTGDCTGKRPGMTDIKARAKYDAWNSRKGMTKEEAMKEYIKVVDSLMK
ncbi:putative esterase [Monocercomonoides exilis]|uniref:putative esterase n=1 Tax=Monocercomonoides exilis TaxID=2049356 RepID=UPI00355AAFE7|nr:putative esterase [Monocercomonoides exilis]|eukprot:MONOS_5445.1-p1 / transcript=MONOS_5445.1 / gene=MONOS_5445 / organism=Monocercomonoides_exilis_PA203 / gene_product=esterase / transcript_product=esterase / location=Mono_scaffold00158:45008-45727(-) / protein_length=201 / sequence_SO=supercontig / SO=protein_coding / is_pseudo=false